MAIVGFSDAIFARKVLEHAVQALMPATAFSTDFSAEAQNPGTKITVPVINKEATTHLKVAGQPYAVDDITTTSADITLATQPTYVSMHITDAESAVNGPMLTTDLFAHQKGNLIAKTVLLDLFSPITAANFGAAQVIGAPSQFNSDVLGDILPLLDEAGFDPGMCSLVLKPTYYMALIKSIADVSKSGSSDPLMRGVVPGLFGLRQVIKSAVIPDNGENLIGFIAHPSAMGVAARYLKPQPGNTYVIARPHTDAETGITLGERKWYSNDTGELRHVLEAIWGKTAFDYSNADKTQNGIIRLTSAA